MEIRILADRWLNPEMARLASGALIAGVAGLVVVMFATERRGASAISTPLGADFGAFYVAGSILGSGRGGELYDLGDQDARLHLLVPGMPAGEHLPFVNPPIVALLFRPIAALPFARGFAAWLSLSVALYAGSIAIVLGRCDALGPGERRTAWLVALSFAPFSIETCLGGQLSSLGCLAVAGSLALQGIGRPALAGLALSALLYKPTLLALILPMLAIGRCWRILGGFALGGAILGALSVAAVGMSGSIDFLDLMLRYGNRGGSVGPGFKTVKFVDLPAFFRLLGADRRLARPLAIAAGLVPFLALARIWARTNRGRPKALAWSAAFCWSPVLSVYGPIYDVTLVIPGLLLAADAIRRESPEAWPIGFRGLLALVYASALFTQASAVRLGLQPLTIALAAMGAYLLRFQGRASGLREGAHR